LNLHRHQRLRLVVNEEMFFYRDDGLFRYYNINPDGTIGKPILDGDGYTAGWSSITAVELVDQVNAVLETLEIE
jgi:hypothetical protein